MAITNASGVGAPGSLPGDPGSEYNRSDGPPFKYKRMTNGWVAADVIDETGQVASSNLPTHTHSTADLVADSVTYAKIQNVTATDKILGRVTAGAGDIEEITCTAAGRALIDDADAAAQRTTLGLGTLATQSGTFSGTSSGTNTGDQTITLTGNVTGSGTGSFAATIANSAVTYAKMQNVSATDKVLGRVTAGAGVVEEIACTAAGRALIDDADATAQRTTLGLGTLATQNGTFSGTSSGTNTGDQTLSDATISLTDITTNNASATKHGFLSKLPNTATQFLRDDGTWQTIAGGGDMLKSTYDPDANGVIALAQLDTLVEQTGHKNAANGYAGLNGSSKLTLSQMTGLMASSDLTNDSALEKVANKNAANGYAGLDANTKLTFSQVPTMYARVTGSDAATTGQSLVNITGLSLALLANAVYEFEAILSCIVSAVTTGCQYGIQFSGAGATIEAQLIGSLTTAASKSERVSALNTASGAYLTSSAQSGQILIKGIVTIGANAGNLTAQHLKVTSGTSTVKINSCLKADRVA